MVNIKLRTFCRANALALLLLASGVVGFVASFVLTLDKFKVLENPNFVPGCNINPIISCGSVMSTSQAGVFGFANSLIGVAAFAGLIGLALALLAGATFQRWLWLLLQGGTIFGLLFVHWLIFESLYRIGTLCPYCMAVWVFTIAAFWYVTLHNLRQNIITTPRRLKTTIRFGQRHHLDILILWYIVLAGLILHRFWYFFNPF
ncbi:MAG: vitamin K epoxide reductase family protein [Candidatus Saccharibacteria bacterium]